jgi:hypothetical protein
MSVITGVFEKMTRAEYDALGFLNYSRLKFLSRSPRAFRDNWDSPTPPTAPMILGGHGHTAILEPTLYKFAIYPGPVRNGKVFDAFCEENAGKIILNQKEANYIEGMAKAVRSNPDAFKYLRYVKTEVTLVWRDPMFKRDFKCRIDAITDIDDEPVMVSLKSTVDCRDFRFESQYYKMSYHVQDALYQNGFYHLNRTLPRMVTIAVESKPPHDSAVYNIPTDVLRQGNADLAKWLETLAECEKSNEWPGAMPGERDLHLPAYAYPGGDFDMSDLEPIANG